MAGRTWNHCCGKWMNPPEHWSDLGNQYRHTCKGAPKCQAVPTHVIRCNYITGRAGRTGVRDLDVCEEHARKFCEKHGIPWDSVPTLDYLSHHQQTIALNRQIEGLREMREAAGSE